jgi:hypothetical protein
MGLNKKQKKQLDLVNKKINQLRQQLSGARKQNDEPGEIERLEQEIAEAETHKHEIEQS